MARLYIAIACVAFLACAVYGAPIAQGSARAETGHFRDIFATYAEDAGFNKTQIDDLIYFPTQDMFDVLSSPSLDDLDAVFNARSQSDVRKAGIERGHSRIADIDRVLLNRENPITIMVFPGIFGEFITHIPFEELFANGRMSAFSRRFRELHATAAREDRTDGVFDLFAMADVDVSLTEILDIASIDSRDGRALANFVYMRPRMASMETLGSLEENRATYIRRLGKFFRVVGQDIGDVFFVGYSRSTPVVMDLVANIAKREAELPWAKKVRGIVGLDGVVWGTPLADCAFADQPPASECGDLQIAVTQLLSLADALTPNNNRSTVLSNTYKWGSTLSRILSTFITGGLPEAMKKYSVVSPSIQATWSGIIRKMFFDEFDLGSFAKSYTKNVERFRLLVKKAVNGAMVLTTKARLDWHRANELPSDRAYVAISATQYDPELVGPSHIDPKKTSPDYFFLRTCYYQIYDFAKSRLNDGQVPVQRELFSSSIHMSLNAKQTPYKFFWATVVGSDHWGDAFPVAFDTNDKWVNPFPRSVFAKTIANYAAWILAQNPAFKTKA
eukprot:Opistho-2@31789